MAIPISELKRGETYWESCGQGNMRFEAISDPWREDGPGGVDRWHIWTRNMSGEESEICSTGDAYGPHIYTEPAYVVIGAYSECPNCPECDAQTTVRLQPKGSPLTRFAEFYCQSCRHVWSAVEGGA